MPLALAARDAGHEVIFGTGESFLARVADLGFDARRLGEALDWGFERAAANHPEFLNPEQPAFGAHMFVDVLGERSLRDMNNLIDETQPDLVVFEGTDVGAGVAASAAGIPALHHSLSVWPAAFRDAMRERLPGLWQTAGTEEKVDVTVGDAYLDIWPESMQAPEARTETVRHIPLRPVPWGDPSTKVPEWVEGVSGPLVFVSLGTMFWGKELLRKVIDALVHVDADALVLAGVDATPDELPAGSERIHVAGFVDQPGVLSRADVVIDHGGAGTMLGALANGLPQLVLPEGADRPYTAASLEASGAGLVLKPREASEAEITDAVRRLLEDATYRDRAKELQHEIRQMPSPAEVVSELEAVAG